MSKIRTFFELLLHDRKKLKIAFAQNFEKSRFSHMLSDKMFLSYVYKAHFGKKLNLKSPQTFNEKLQWLKLYYRTPEQIKLVDKYEVKKYITETIGEEYIIPTLGIYERFEDINFDVLPDQFVLKCTHDSGSVVICKDKSTFDYASAKTKLSKKLKNNLFWHGREWPYKNVKPRIIAEQYMEDKNTEELRDYKFFCFDGEVKALFVATERQKAGEEVKFDFFDTDFNHLELRQGHPNAKTYPEKPEKFDEMKLLAAKLSVGIPHVRVDFYEVNGQIYFGELTFFHFNGMVPFVPGEWDKTLGDWINLPEKT